MVNYNNSLIYKLCCKNTNIKDIYIGSTTNFTRRKYQHKNCSSDINSQNFNQYKYKFIRDNGGWDNWDMILIEKVNCNDKLELRKKEREYIEKFNSSLNMKLSYRDIKEKKQMRKEYLQNYREENKEELKDKYNYSEKRKIKITCDCGSEIRKADLARHCRTKKHIQYIENNKK